MTEYEKKALLTENEYDVLMSKYDHLQSSIQHNYYYDTDDLILNSYGVTCRIRKKGEKCEATIKHHIAQEKGMSTEEDVSTINAEGTSSFAPFGVPLQGELVTERTVIHKEEDCEALLDKNIYLGCADHELEVEYTEGNESKADEIIDEIADELISSDEISSRYELISRIGKCKPKSNRFFEKRFMKRI